jgi:hypothetical protein
VWKQGVRNRFSALVPRSRFRWQVSFGARSLTQAVLPDPQTWYNAFKTTLRSDVMQRLRSSVDMTSDVKSGQQLFLDLHEAFLSFVHWKSRSQKDTTIDPAAIRGLMTTFLASVGCLPQSRDEHPCGLPNAAGVTLHRGCASSHGRWQPSAHVRDVPFECQYARHGGQTMGTVAVEALDEAVSKGNTCRNTT